jgi:gluconolactonase
LYHSSIYVHCILKGIFDEAKLVEMKKLFSLLLFALLFLAITPAIAQIEELNWPVEVVSEGHGFTEGASLAPDGSIYFSDMDKQNILRFDPLTGQTSVWQAKSGKTNGLYIMDGMLYGCEAAGRSIVRYDLEKGPASRKVLSSMYKGDSLGCPNDLTVIGKNLYFSEFWIESFHKETGATRQIFENRVYALNIKSMKLDSLDFDFDTPNGVASSPDGSHLFVGDISANRLYRSKVIKGKAGPMELFLDLDDLNLLGPDGMTIGADGRIFLALFRSDGLLVLEPDGSPIGFLATGPLTSNCIFAADDKTLYFTSERMLKRVVIPDL